MASSPWEKLGQAASVMQLTGVDALGLVSMIVQAAQIARRNRDLCRQLAEHVQIVGGLLQKLQIPELRRYPETRRPLDQLNDALFRTYRLVRSCSQQQENTSQLYQMLTGAGVADKLRRAQEEIDRYITLVPVITAVAVVIARGATGEEAPDDTTNVPTLAQRPALSLQDVTELLALEGPPPIGTVAVKIQEGTQQPAIVEEVPSRPEQWRHGDPSSVNGSAEEFTLDQLSRATKGFSPEFTLGSARFYTCYWGDLGYGREVAINRFKLGPHSPRYRKEYRSGLAFISSLQHRNLVRLLGYCMAPERLLVYDYMKNGSLLEQLKHEASQVVSSWKLRIKILLDASRGIDYLHSCAVPPLIHGNIRSGNILLDSEWVAHVSDLVHPLMEPEVEPMRAVGYLGPEHDAPQRLTVKSDVYSFGVVMLEVLTGKRPMFKEVQGGRLVSLVKHTVPSIAAGELHEVVDRRAGELGAHGAEAVELVASTAMLCVQPKAKDRPVMADIVTKLETAFALFETKALDEILLPTSGVQISDPDLTLRLSLV
ncbi:hypothetical protein ACP70R_040880 [Stipagrostis hirtigluma subsp. patula]